MDQLSQALAYVPAPPDSDDPGVDLPPRLRCEGGQLVKPNGQPIWLHGPCFGAIGYDTPEDAAAVKPMGANCVRVNLKWHGVWGDRPEADSRDDQGVAFLKRANVVDWFAKIDAVVDAGMWAVPCVDSNCGQLGTQDDEMIRYCDPYGTFGAAGRNFFTDPSLRRLYAQIVWPAVAAQLRLRPRIAMLEFQPEPAGGRGPEYIPIVQDFYREVIEGVRPFDPDTPILIGPYNGYAIEECDTAYLPERTDCVYTGNLLNQYVVNPDRFDKCLDRLVAMRDDRGVPIYVQQVGRRRHEDRDLALMRHAVQRLREREVGYAWWVWKQHTSNPDNYALLYPQDDGSWAQKDDEIALLAEDWASA